MLDLGFLWFQQPGWPQRSLHWAFCTGGHCSSDSLWNGCFSPNKLFKLSTGWGLRLDESRSITLIYLTQAIKSHLAHDGFLGGWGRGGRTDGPLVRRSVSRFLQSMLYRWGIYLTPVAPDAHLSVCVNVARFPRLLVGNALSVYERNVKGVTAVCRAQHFELALWLLLYRLYLLLGIYNR